jgi:hypothetical protein
MGTRGAFGVIIGEKEKLAYNHFDSYPEGKGIEVLQWLRDADMKAVRRLSAKARVIDPETKPTAEDKKRLKPYTDLGVSKQSEDDWYCLTRSSQGDMSAMLDSGYVLDAGDFPLDSLFCEWAYIIDLDTNGFEVYRGFQEKDHKAGRFGSRASRNGWKPEYKGQQYFAPIALAKSWPLDALPSDEDFLAEFGRED